MTHLNELLTKQGATMNKKIMRLAVAAGFLDGDLELFPETIERFAQLVRLDEREACAALCEKFIPNFDDGVFFAKVIRARGNHENAPLP